jgi:glutathione peroxidase
MKTFITLLLFSVLCFKLNAQLKTFHNFTASTIIDQKALNLSDFAGKKVLVVNLASYCGFTCQYAELVTLDSLYGGPNFAIIGFPCNDFGSQEPNNDSTILATSKTFGVKFQMMHKIIVKGTSAIPLYKWLQTKVQNGVADAPVTWNFNKFCIDEAGHWVQHFPEAVTPLDPAIVNWIKSGSVLESKELNNSSEISLVNPAFQKINIKVKAKIPTAFAIRLFDLQGRQIDQLFSGRIDGEQIVSYGSEKLNSGIYFIRVQNEVLDKTIKISYLK